MISPSASSATERLLLCGSLKTAMPRWLQAARVDLVHADAERADREQLGSRLQGRPGDVGLRADAQERDVAQFVLQLVFAERAREALDLEPRAGEVGLGGAADALQQ